MQLLIMGFNGVIDGDSVCMALYVLVLMIVVGFAPAGINAFLYGLECSHTRGFEKEL